VDLSLAPIFSFIDHAAGPAAAGFGAWIIVKANTFLGLQSKSLAQDNLDQALYHGEALMVNAWKSLESHNATVKVPDNTVTEIASKVIALAPGAETLLGATPDSLAPILESKLAQWLHWQAQTQAPTVAPAPAAEPAAPAPAPATA
jgi:hypothetical protein